jgi:SAM-dependent methyltransferase
MTNSISQFDIDALNKIRSNVEAFMDYAARTYENCGGRLLDIAPQVHCGAAPFFRKSLIETLDIDPASGAAYIADLCQCADTMPAAAFDFIVCTEVLEHTRQPFDAVNSIYAMLKRGGHVFVSTPYNFRIHGPLPDCWRFTEHGLRELFRNFEIIELKALETDDRWLMPIQYTLVARRPND